MSNPFSFQRLFLILSWISFAAVVILINSHFNPNYNKETVSITISLFCFINTALLITGLLGINKKVQNVESEQWKKEFREQYKEDLTEIHQQIHEQVQTIVGNPEDTDLKLFNEQMETASVSWKTKVKTDYSPFEEYHYLQHKLRIYKKIFEVISLFFSLSTGLIVLNISYISLKVYLGYAAIVVILLMILFYSASLSKQSRKLRERIYPDTLKDFLKSFDVW